MTSVLRRLSEASATSLMCSGLLSSTVGRLSALGSIFHPNFVAITTRSRKGARASPTSSSLNEWAVHFSSIEECDTAFDGRANQRNALLLVYGWAVAVAQPHAAEPYSRDFQIAFSKFALLHCFSFELLYAIMSRSRRSFQ